ncbi:MAG: c-type cytochrome [Gammaproteobacteria bacterium]
MQTSVILAGIIATCLLAAAVAADSTAAETTSNDLERGQRILNKCLVCHTVGAGEAHSAGPNLYALVNRPVGKQDGYKFSRALRKSEANWTLDLLDQFLASPAKVFPRNRMAFAGLNNDADRAALLKVLATLKD